MNRSITLCAGASVLAAASLLAHAAGESPHVAAATAADQIWALGVAPPVADNPITQHKVELGKALFFDPRLSGNGTVSCASCHNPALGWSDGLKTGIGINGTVLGRATPTIVNVAYNSQFMWDGRKKSLEDQALGPMKAPEEMKTDLGGALQMLAATDGYVEMFGRAFPGQPISEETLAKAIAAFERTVVSKDSRFDRWLAGDRSAITTAEWRGFQVFKDPAKGNCAACHSGANFTDNGFHNIGIKAGASGPDEGRFKIRPLAAMKGAFKTPTLRDIALTAPYFRDGSAATLMDVVEHYDRGGDDHSNLSKDVRPLRLSQGEKGDLVAFMNSLTGRALEIAIPVLPQSPITAQKSAPLRTAQTGK
ncbi:MAG: c-type cytochrome [Burkholderiaceae bacterium]|nr:c-type cytochrome [Burkholderiaceae bacterium]